MEAKPEFMIHSPVISEISLVFKYVDPVERYPMRNSGRRHNGLLYALEGREEYRMKDCSLKTAPGDIVFLPKGEVYDVFMADRVCEVMCVDFETADPYEVRPFIARSAGTRMLKGGFMELERIWQYKRAGWQAECMSLLYHIVSEVQKQLNNGYCPREKLERLQPGIDYIHRHIDDREMRIDAIAGCCGLHPRYFAKLFHEVYGKSPKQYMTEIRMERARELIMGNRYTVTEIARMTGYSDIYHFSKTFRRVNSIAPTEYREKGEMR